MTSILTVGDLLRVLEQMPKDRQIIVTTNGVGVQAIGWHTTRILTTSDGRLETNTDCTVNEKEHPGSSARGEELGPSRDVLAIESDYPGRPTSASLRRKAKRATTKFLKSAPEPQVEPDECRSCRGKGYFDSRGRATIDRRGRACGDCRGTGKA